VVADVVVVVTAFSPHWLHDFLHNLLNADPALESWLQILTNVWHVPKTSLQFGSSVVETAAGPEK